MAGILTFRLPTYYITPGRQLETASSKYPESNNRFHAKASRLLAAFDFLFLCVFALGVRTSPLAYRDPEEPCFPASQIAAAATTPNTADNARQMPATWS